MFLPNEPIICQDEAVIRAQLTKSCIRLMTCVFFYLLLTPDEILSFGFVFQPLRTTLDDGHGSAGPIRRFRNKTVADSPSKPSVDFRFPSINASPAGSSQVWEGFSPAVKKNLEPAGTSKSSIFQSVENKLASSKTSVPIVHPHSSQMAKTILDLLERNPPTPKDKSAELKLAALWKKSDSSTVSSAIPNQPSSSLYLGGLDSSRVTDRGDKMGPAQRNEARATTFFRTPQETKNHADGTASDSNLKGNNEGPLRNTLASPFQNQHEVCLSSLSIASL